jgi:Zn-dependent peptidase ImmA (M78 family)/transcriptional regulator with XRE-family HTH domain
MIIDWVALAGRLARERTRLALSQREVAQEAGVPQTLISRLERGERTRVELAELNRVALALGRSFPELLEDSPVRLRAELAARLGSSAADIDAAKERVLEILELDAALDDVVERRRHPAGFAAVEVPAGGAKSTRGARVADRARELLSLANAPVTDVTEVLEQLTGVDVGTAALGSVSGVCGHDPVRDVRVILTNSSDVRERQRFTFAHELGHLLTGSIAHVDVVDGQRNPVEILCDEFARGFLIPQPAVRAWLSLEGLTGHALSEREVALLGRHFGVSPDVVSIQLERMHVAAPRQGSLASAAVLARRYGWDTEYGLEQKLAAVPQPPRRVQARAMQAYRAGRLGAAAVARLEGRTVADIAERLDALAPTERPPVRRANVTALVARARSQS